MKNQPVTLIDVAKYAGVSASTVSRVLHQNPKVDEVLRQRVLHAVQVLKYQPNANAQSLKTNHTYVIGFLVSDISNPYYGIIARTIENIISPRNYNLILCSHAELPERESSYLTMLMQRHVEVLVINPTCENNSQLAQLSSYIPTITMNRKVIHPDFVGDYIDTDGYAGCYALAKRLLAAGHRDIYCVHAPFKYPNAVDRFRGFVDAMAEYGITVDENYPFLFDGKFTEQGGVNAIRHMASFSSRMPTAILSLSNLSTLGILEMLQKCGISIPQDVSVATHDQIENSGLFRWRPETATYDLQEIAETVGNLILYRVQNRETKPVQKIFEPIILHGNTIAHPSNTLGAKLIDALWSI